MFQCVVVAVARGKVRTYKGETSKLHRNKRITLKSTGY